MAVPPPPRARSAIYVADDAPASAAARTAAGVAEAPFGVERLEQLAAMFHKYDEDASETIDADELAKVERSVGG